MKNEKGELIIPQKYVSILVLEEGHFMVYEEDPGWPMIINQKNEVLISKTNYIAKTHAVYKNHFICQYYKEGKMAELVLMKAPDTVLYTFPIKYIMAEFEKDSCYTYVKARSDNPGESLSVNLKGSALTGPENGSFDYIKGFFKPCNGYAEVMKDKGYEGTLSGVYDLNTKKMVLPCSFYDVEYDAKNATLKAYRPVQTSTYDLYNLQGVLLKTWDQLKK